MSLTSMGLEVGFAELHILVIRRNSKVNLTSELQYFNIFQVTDYCVVIFLV